MPKKTFAAALNDQIANEFAAAMQYIGVAVHYDTQTLPRLAAFFYRQAIEERGHAMMMVQYLLDVDEAIKIPDIKGQQSKFKDDVAPVKLALEQEKRVGEEIYSLFELARETKDYRAEQFMQWFVTEQVEEVKLMQDSSTWSSARATTCCWSRTSWPARRRARAPRRTRRRRPAADERRHQPPAGCSAARRPGPAGSRRAGWSARPRPARSAPSARPTWS